MDVCAINVKVDDYIVKKTIKYRKNFSLGWNTTITPQPAHSKTTEYYQ